MTRYEKTAARAVDKFLRENRHARRVSLYEIAQIADAATYNAGKKRDLYPSLWDYTRILPKSASGFWAKNGFYCIKNPYCSWAEKACTAEKAVYMPGFFDAGVDLGPDAYRIAAREGRLV